MPVFRHELRNAPAWCKIEDFEILHLRSGEGKAIVPRHPREHVIVAGGKIELAWEGGGGVFETKGQASLPPGTPWGIRCLDEAEVVVLRGRWEAITGSGLFAVKEGTPPAQETPHDYEKTAAFDRHYHDCDEVWVILSGLWSVSSEDRFYELEAGDALATGMGWHHDVVRLHGQGPHRGAWMETEIEGRGRKGHLWEPVHGKAEPQRDRA